MLYKNCRELPYHNFNEIQIEGDLKYLIKDTEIHEDNELQDHWLKILEERLKANNDFEQKKFFRDKAELNYLQVKLTVLEGILPLYLFDLTDEQQEQIQTILKLYRVSNIEQDILGTKDDINIKISALKKGDDSEKKGSFDKTLAVMRMNGYNVNRFDITVSEFDELISQMKINGIIK